MNYDLLFDFCFSASIVPRFSFLYVYFLFKTVVESRNLLVILVIAEK